jgi:FkbM family methyltransferase
MIGVQPEQGGWSAATVARRTASSIWAHPENRGVRGRRLARWMAWQAWQRTVRRPWTVRWHGGLRLVCHPHDHVTTMALYYGLYDRAEMRFLLAWLRAGDTFLDVGANVAPYSLLSTLIPGVRAVAFEPGTRAGERAAANITLNGVSDAVTLVPRAVSDRDGAARLSADRWATNALVDGDYAGEAEEVETVSLDSYVTGAGIEQVSVVKVDVEGHEPAVLAGAGALLARDRPALIVELNEVGALRRFAGDSGYTLVAYDADTRTLDESSWPGVPGCNAVLVPDLVRAQARVGR